MKSTKDGRFRIDDRERSDDSYMNSYTSYSWSVFSTELGEEILSYSGRWDGDATGESKSGTAHVKFSDDESEVVVEDFDGTIERVSLPITFRLSDDERSLIYVYRDGREEQHALFRTFNDDSDAVPEYWRKEFRKDDAKRAARLKVILAKVAPKGS
jgi:hypothetical protein